MGLGLTILIPFGVAYVVASFIYCIFSDSWVNGFFVGFFEWVLDILSDFELWGIILIFVLIFPIICIVIVLAIVFSIFTFPFTVARHNKKK